MPKINIISKKEFEEIQDQAAAATDLLESPRFQFFRDYLKSTSGYVEESILNNTVRDVKEIVTINDRLTKMFFTPKKIQVDELVGQYKLIKKLYADLQQFIVIKKDLDSEIAAGRVKVDDGKE